MFKKLVSNLPFNPSLITQVSFYGARMKQEAALRRMGFAMMALALFVHMFAVISPPQPTLASSGNDIVYGGVRANGDVDATKQNILSAMSDDTVGTAYGYYNITREDILNPATTITRINVGDAKYRSAGRWSYGLGNEVEKSFLNGVVFYERDLAAVAIDPGADTDVLAGRRADGTWFAIMLSCGNPVIDTTSTPVPPTPKPVTGFLDSLTCDIANGWVYDPRLTSNSLLVHIYVDNVIAAHVLADQQRPDVNSSLGISGGHGWTWNIPSVYKDGNTHSVSVYGIENVAARGVAEGNTPLNGSPRSFTCAAPVPPPAPPTPTPTPTPPPPAPKTIQVCRGGAIITINESDRTSTDLTPDQCDSIVICRDNKLVTIKKYERINEPYVCPTIQICRDGQLVTITTDQKLPTDKNSDECDSISVCEGNTLITIKKFQFDKTKHRAPDATLGCDVGKPKISKSKKAANLTRKIDDANDTTANPGDEIKYTLITANTGNASGQIIIDENLNDVLEYADFVSSDNGSFDKNSHYVTWGNTALAAGAQVSHTIVVRIKAEIPKTPQGSTNSSSQSYDLVLNNVYGNAVNIKLPAPTVKVIENTTKELPNTGPGSSLVVGFVITAIVGYFFARSRLFDKELDIIRTEYAMSGGN